MSSLQTIQEIINGHRLPTLPAVAAQVLEMTSEDDIDIRRIADVVQMDQALAGKVLRTVNSSFYGLSRPCGTVRQAMVYLGLNTVKTLVLSFSLVETVDGRGADLNGFNFTDYWRRSIHCAVAARELARKTGAWDPEEAFLAGLMQDVGVIALYRQFGPAYLEQIASARGDHSQVRALEMAAWNCDHAQLSAAIAERWQLPRAQVEAIRHHHDATPATIEFRAHSRIIDLAGRLSAAMDCATPRSALAECRVLARNWFDIDAKRLQAIIIEVGDANEAIASLFSINTGSSSGAECLLATAEEQLVAHQLDMDRKTAALQSAKADLEEQVMTDPLTGAWSRRALEETLAMRLQAAQDTRRRVAVLFCDANRFKQINDEYGHLAGDAVLKHIASLLDTHTREESIVGRYGGDEFVIVLPNCALDAACQVGQRLQEVITTTPCPAGDGWPAMLASVSIGVACSNPEAPCSAQELIDRADQAMYEDKQSGRSDVLGRIDHAA